MVLLLFLAGSGGAQRRSLEQEIVDAHNAVRARVGVPPLTWSGEMATRAQEWADDLLARKQFRHRPDTPYGQNLFDITGAPASADQVVTVWADEARNYNYRTNRCHGVCGHYTQVVWRDTRQVGCAVARGGGREVWVCDYDPAGNWKGQRPY